MVQITRDTKFPSLHITRKNLQSFKKPNQEAFLHQVGGNYVVLEIDFANSSCKGFGALQARKEGHRKPDFLAWAESGGANMLYVISKEATNRFRVL